MDFLAKNPWIWIVIILVVAALIGGISFLIHKIITKNTVDEKPSEEEIAQENLQSILEPVEDEEAKKQFEDYVNNEEKKD